MHWFSLMNWPLAYMDLYELTFRSITEANEHCGKRPIFWCKRSKISQGRRHLTRTATSSDETWKPTSSRIPPAPHPRCWPSCRIDQPISSVKVYFFSPPPSPFLHPKHSTLDLHVQSISFPHRLRYSCLYHLHDGTIGLDEDCFFRSPLATDALMNVFDRIRCSLSPRSTERSSNQHIQWAWHPRRQKGCDDEYLRADSMLSTVFSFRSRQTS